MQKILKFFSVIVVISILLLAVSYPTPTIKGNRIQALVGATLIDGTGADPLSESLVIIQHGRILAVGSRSEMEVPARAKIIDVTGKFILPGFINAHVHSGLRKEFLQQWAYEGVTTVRDLGSNPEDLAEFRAGEPLKLRNARLVAAGPLVTVPGGYPIVPWGVGSSALTVGSPEDAREQVEDLLDNGANLIKIAMESGTIFGQNIPMLSPQQASMIVRTAHGRGTKVSAHVTAVSDLEPALDAGVDDIAHMVVDDVVPDDLIRKMVEEHIYWVPTLELWHGAATESESGLAIRNLHRFISAGGRVALGTDFFGYSMTWEIGMPMKEIGWMQEAGMTNMEIIVAATQNAACVCNLERDLGTVEKGKIADLIILNSNPLVDISALEDVYMVFHEGKKIRDER